MRLKRIYRILPAMLAMAVALSGIVLPAPAEAEPTVYIGMITDGIWRLDPTHYTYRALQNVKELNLSGKRIRGIEGIEHLGGLVSLDLSYNELESVDLSSCWKLTELYCSNNRLSELNLAPCKRLKVLDCSDNPIGELDVSQTKNLQTLDCRNCGLKTLDLTANRTLTELYCSGNELPNLIVAPLKKLKTLDAAGIGVSVLDVSPNEALTALDCSGNPELKELNVKSNTRLHELHTEGTAITSLDLSAQRTLASAFSARNGYRYEYTEDSRTWMLEDGGVLTAGADATIRVGSSILIQPVSEDPRSQIALPGYMSYKPGEFTNTLLRMSFDELCHYFSMTVGPNGSIFPKADEGWIFENAHTVVESAGVAVQARRKETDKIKSATRVFTIFDQEGNFKFRCAVDYMANEDAKAYARRLNAEHETLDEVDLLGFTGLVRSFACGNALITLEGIPSGAQEKTPTLESYILSNPATPLYLIH